MRQGSLPGARVLDASQRTGRAWLAGNSRRDRLEDAHTRKVEQSRGQASTRNDGDATALRGSVEANTCQPRNEGGHRLWHLRFAFAHEQVRIRRHLGRAVDAIEKVAVPVGVLGLPLAGTLSAEQNLARFTRTLGSLLRTGVPMLPALASARSAVRNRHIGSGLDASLESVRDGQSLGRALSGRPGIPRVALRMITVGEETGKLDEMLLRTALVLERQSQRRIEHLMTLLTPALTIAIAGLIGGLILAVMNAIFSVNELVLR